MVRRLSLLVGSLLMSSLLSAQSTNLLANPGFEHGASTWRLAGGAAVSRRDSVDGQHSLELPPGAFASEAVRLSAGTYELRAFFQAPRPQAASIQLDCGPGHETTVSTDTPDASSPAVGQAPSDWTELHAPGVALGQAAACTVTLLAKPANTSAVLADAVVLARHTNLFSDTNSAWKLTGMASFAGGDAALSGGSGEITQTLHIEPGAYTFAASYRSSGGQRIARLEAVGCSDRDSVLNLAPASIGSAFRQVELRGFRVTRPSCTIGVRVQGSAGQWLSVKDMRVEPAPAGYNMVQGGDISLTDMVEGHGGIYRLHGQPGDPFAILAASGMNLARIHLFVDPGNPAHVPSSEMQGRYDDFVDALRLARRARAAGMRIELSLHLSDHWADPQCQSLPHAWLSLDADGLSKTVRAYVAETLHAFAAQGTPVELVAIGNETDPGILRTETCKSPLHGVNADFNASPDLLARIYQAGYQAAHAEQHDIRVLWHLANIGRYAETRRYLDAMLARGAHVDVLAYSAYPFWSRKTVRQFQDFANYVTARYKKPVFFEETGYPWAPAAGADNMADGGPEPYPLTPQGQLDFLNDEISAVESADDGMVIGFSYWDASWIPAPGTFDNVDNYVLFDREGNALPALTVGFQRSSPTRE